MACNLRSSVLKSRINVKTNLPTPRLKLSRPVVCQAQSDEPSKFSQLAVPVASLVAAAFVLNAAVPLETLAGSSGGRVGGSGFSRGSSRSGGSGSYGMPSRSSSTTVNSTTVYAAPPVYSPPAVVVAPSYGYSSWGFMPTFVTPTFVPFPFFGGFLQFFFLALAASAVFSVIRGFVSKNNKKDDDWGEL